MGGSPAATDCGGCFCCENKRMTSSPQGFQVILIFSIQSDGLVKRLLDFGHDERLDDVALLDVVELLNADTALHAG